MKKKIKLVIATFARSEYGLLEGLIEKISNNKDFKLDLVYGGSHVSNNYGLSEFKIKRKTSYNRHKVNFFLNKDNPYYLSAQLGRLTISLSKVLKQIKPNFLICMGDRYELLPLCTVCTLLGIPIVHLSGGTTSKGAIDNQIRNAVTKLSHLHFVSHPKFKKKLELMGEEKWRVTVTGEPGLDGIKNFKFLTKKKIEEKIGTKLPKKFGIFTFHPETFNQTNFASNFEEINKSLKKMDIFLILTGANPDPGGLIINSKLKKISKDKNNSYPRLFIKNLGRTLYLSLLRKTKILIGNSSSAIVEAPSFGVYGINIGERQEGRLTAKNIINAKCNAQDIIKKFSFILKKKKTFFLNPYEKKNSNKIIINKIKKISKKYSRKEILIKNE